MRSVGFSGQGFIINGKKSYIRSGELQYWRLPKDVWEDRIRKAVEGGLNCIGSYIPWFWHEPEEGRFDFTGKTCPEKDLVYWIDLIEKYGLYFFARPGPFINGNVGSMLGWGGHPDWVFRTYPEVWSLDAGRRYSWGPKGPTPAYLHPRFLELADNWYTALAEVLVPHSHDSGGCVIAFQPDNEPGFGFNFNIEGALYDPHVIGERGLWQDWVLKTYGTLEKINERYGLSLQCIDELQPPERALPDVTGQRLTLDWLRFKMWYVFTYLLHLTRKMRSLGLNVPYAINEPIDAALWWSAGDFDGDYAEFAKFLREQGERIILMGHNYIYYGEVDNWALPGIVRRIEMLKSTCLDYPPFSAEFAASPTRRATYNLRNTWKVCVGHGVNGYNLYVFAEGTGPFTRDNHTERRTHEGTAPISPNGELRPHYYHHREFSRFIGSWEQEILESEKRYDAVVTVFTELPLMARHTHFKQETTIVRDSGRETIVDSDIQSEILDSVWDLFDTLTCLGIDVAILNLIEPNRDPAELKDKLLIVPNGGIIRKEGYRFIIDLLEAGGRVFFYPTIPTMDEDFRTHDELRKLVGFKLHQTRKGASYGRVGQFIPDMEAQVVLGMPRCEISLEDWPPQANRFVDGRKAKQIAISGKLNIFRPPTDAEVLVTHQGKACVYRRQVLNGEVILCGFAPNISNYAALGDLELAAELFLEHAQVERCCFSEDGLLHIVQRKGPKGILLTVGNLLGWESQTRIIVDTGERKLYFPKLLDVQVHPNSVWFYWVALDLGAFRIEYCTSELLPLNDARTRFQASGDVNTPGEIAFDRKVSLTVAGKEAELTELEGFWIATYNHDKGSVIMDIIPE